MNRLTTTHKYFYTNENFQKSNYSVFFPLPTNFCPYRDKHPTRFTASLHSLFSKKNNFQFSLFVSQRSIPYTMLVEEDDDPRNNGSEVRARGAVSSRSSLYLSGSIFYQHPVEAISWPFLYRRTYPSQFLPAVPQPSRSSRSAYLRAFPSIKQPRA